MVSPILTEHFYTAGFLVSQAPGELSFDKGIIANAGTVDLLQEAGLVLSQAVAGTPTIAAVGTLTGKGTLASLALNNADIVGAYTAVATSATVFSVIDPNGDELAPATVGTAYADPEIGFQITAGATAFAAGDSFTITIPSGTGNYASYTGTPGLPAAAVLYNLVWVPAGGTAAVTVVRRSAEVNRSEVQWDPTVVNSGSVVALEAAAWASLAKSNIIPR